LGHFAFTVGRGEKTSTIMAASLQAGLLISIPNSRIGDSKADFAPQKPQALEKTP
jgi:hypothetical protein